MDPIAVMCENRPGTPQALTVTQVARVIRDTVRANPILSRILVRGEVSNLQRAPAGHVFFTLKDATAQISCTLFREDAEMLGFDLEDGMDVVVSGDVDVFPRRGSVQLLIKAATPAGVGAFWAAYQKTRKKLAAEGLFDAARKRPLPAYPRKIGVVTSEVGAVVHDIVTILRRRYPIAHIIIAPALVQGPEAPASLRRALAFLADPVARVIVARDGPAATATPEGLAGAGGGAPGPPAAAVRGAGGRRSSRGHSKSGAARSAWPASRRSEPPRDIAGGLCHRRTGGRPRRRTRLRDRIGRRPRGPLPGRPDSGSRQPGTGGTMTEEPNFEESLAALEATVDALSRGDLPLDRALAVFEEGLGLYRRCHAILADSEQRVTKLIAAAEGLIEEPFPVE